ncbi:MAG TPA: DUF2892 domain-containing protein [Candidatus Limnocylindria bacterium]|jgi:hypothetical protein|nr:DUF2892 domain-containing protein [Candidatus Limnocylindria bacterium]
MKASVFTELACPAERRGWKTEARVRAVAGTLVLLSAALAAFVDVRWLLLTAFVGANLLQSSITGWCLMSNLLALAERRTS